MNKDKLEYKIKVMTHFLEGGEIEYRVKSYQSGVDDWKLATDPLWSWELFEYRVKEKESVNFPVYAKLKNVNHTLIVKFESEVYGEVIEDDSGEYKIGDMDCYWVPIYNDTVWEILPDYIEKPKTETYYEVLILDKERRPYLNDVLHTEEGLNKLEHNYIKTGRSFELPVKGDR